MAHDVYVCYDERDLEIAKDVCDKLETNGLECWLKNRDAGVKNIVNEIMDAIKKSKVMVLLYSENSKNSNFVNNEVDIAFKEKRSILVYQIDESKFEGGLEFFLSNKPWIKAYPDSEYDKLIKDTKNLVKEQKRLDRSVGNIVKKHKVPIIIGVIALLLVVGVLGFMMSNGVNGDANATQLKVGDIELKITDFKSQDVRKQNLGWNYSFIVEGTLSPPPNEANNCVIVVDFYDNQGYLVDTTETSFNDAQISGSGYLLGSTTSDENNIKVVDVQLINSDNLIIAEDESQI